MRATVNSGGFVLARNKQATGGWGCSAFFQFFFLKVVVVVVIVVVVVTAVRFGLKYGC